MIEQLGAVPENVEVLWQSPPVARDNLEFGITRVYLMRNPRKLARLDEPAALARST